MRSFFISFATVSVGIIGVACSSSSGGHKDQDGGGAGTGGASGGAGTGGAVGSAGGAGASGGSGTGGASGAASTGGSNAGGAAGASDGGSSPPDIAKTPECTAYCGKAKACGATCDPSTDCAVTPGSCYAAHRAYLGCVAATGTFQCSSDGFATASTCQEDTSVCPVLSTPDAGSCPLSPPDPTCVTCMKKNCATDYSTLYADSELPDFSACVAACETACNVPAVCPAMCPDSVSAFSEYTDLLYCANVSCANVCKTVTVIF